MQGPSDSVCGLIQASNVNEELRLRLGELGTLIKSSVPLRLKAWPTLPGANIAFGRECVFLSAIQDAVTPSTAIKATATMAAAARRRVSAESIAVRLPSASCLLPTASCL